MIPGSASGRITSSEMASRPKNAKRETASEASVPRTSARAVAPNADRERVGRVGDEAVERDADVHREDVALRERVRSGDAVNHHVVRRGADRGRVATVALEGRKAALRADVVLGDPVELLRGHAGPGALAQECEDLGDDRPCARHPLDLLLGLADDHRTAACSSALWISAKTSSTGGSAGTPTRIPRAR